MQPPLLHQPRYQQPGHPQQPMMQPQRPPIMSRPPGVTPQVWVIDYVICTVNGKLFFCALVWLEHNMGCCILHSNTSRTSSNFDLKAHHCPF